MSTTPTLDPQQQQPPPMAVAAQQDYTADTGHASVGPVIAVLALITILGAIAVMIGRLCSGRRIMGHTQYDFEGWVESKCASCIDGRLDPTPARAAAAGVNNPSRTNSDSGGDSVPVAVQTETPQEMREEDVSQQQQQQHQQRERAETS